MNKQLQNSTVVPQVIACSSDPDEMVMRVELLVDATASAGGFKNVVSTEHVSYPVEEVNSVNNPAFETLRSVYSKLGPEDRVEVLVFNAENRLKHAFVDGVVEDDRRAFTMASKLDRALDNMWNDLDRYADQLHIPHLSPIERELSEVIYDDMLVRNTLTNEL